MGSKRRGIRFDEDGLQNMLGFPYERSGKRRVTLNGNPKSSPPYPATLSGSELKYAVGKKLAFIGSKCRWPTTAQRDSVPESFLETRSVFHVIDRYAGFKTITLRIGIVIFPF